MKLDLPFWFRQRQAKADEQSQGVYKITGPNLPEGIVGIRIDPQLRWRGYLQEKLGASERAETAAYGTAVEAMAAAFELYRTHMIV